MVAIKDVLKHMVKDPEITMEGDGFEMFKIPQGQIWIINEDEEHDGGSFPIDNIQVDKEGVCWVNGQCDDDYSRYDAYDCVEINTFIKTQVKYW
jgi:hypothetical protein